MEGSLVAYKVFTNGSVLNASEINDNLMNQSVMVFSNSTARAAALTAPLEGMLTWLQDTNKYENYNGSAWVALGSSAILQVVSANYSTTVSTTSSSYVTSGLTATITPSSTTSKIMILARTNGSSANNATVGTWSIFRGTVAGTNLGPAAGMSEIYTSAAGNIIVPVSGAIVDSPSTISAQVYTLGMKTNGGGGIVQSQTSGTQANIILIEVAG
jgi:hypothetical protein